MRPARYAVVMPETSAVHGGRRDAPARAARILTDHRDQVDVLAAALIRRRRLTGRQIHDLLQHRPEKK